MMGVEFRSCRREESFKAGGVGFSRKTRDQTKNSFIDTQIDNKVNFSFYVAFEPTCPISSQGSHREPVRDFDPLDQVLERPNKQTRSPVVKANGKLAILN